RPARALWSSAGTAWRAVGHSGRAVSWAGSRAAARPATARAPGVEHSDCRMSFLTIRVTNRVSWFWCGQRLFDDPGHDWSGWLAQQWESVGQPVAAVQTLPVPEPVLEKAA